MVIGGGPLLVGVTWQSPDTYQPAGLERGTATSTSTTTGTTSRTPASRLATKSTESASVGCATLEWCPARVSGGAARGIVCEPGKRVALQTLGVPPLTGHVDYAAWSAW